MATDEATRALTSDDALHGQDSWVVLDSATAQAREYRPWLVHSACGHEWRAHTDDQGREQLATHGQMCQPGGFTCCPAYAMPVPQAGAPATCNGCGKVWTIRRDRWDGEFCYLTPQHAAEVADPRWTAGRPYAADFPVTYYRASVTIRRPVDDPASDMYGGSHEVGLRCEHQHATPAAAEACGRALAAREVKRRNLEEAAARATAADAGEVFGLIERSGLAGN
jgi:hypothetical protein